MGKQLYEKFNGEYNKIFPLNYIQNIIDEEDNTTLWSILKGYNNIYIPYQGNIEDTRNLIPLKMRRKGLWITYEVNGDYTTEYYKGTTSDIQEHWADDINWEIVPDLKLVQNEASKLPDGIITPDKLSPALQELIKQGNNITNLPDDEDLEERNGVISFKDRKYNQYLASGKGYKILRKNWVKGRNILTQDMINEPNIIYEIRYDFNLNKQTLVLPKGATLLFKGGSINNGVVQFNGGTIIGADKFEDCGNASFTGNWSKGLIMSFDDTPKWWNGTEWVAFASGSGTDVETTDGQAEATVSLDKQKFNFTFAIPRGAQGPQGPQGLQGPAGDIAVSTQTFIVFKSTGESLAVPDTPTGGHWNSATNEFTPPIGWSRIDKLEGIVWMSSGIFKADTGELTDGWTTPVRITGQNGSNGTDGTSIEFIYKLTATSLEEPHLDTTDSPNTNNYIPEGWTDSPSGISAEMQCEWVSTRTKNAEGSWNDWTEPVIWSKWGINGTDGDGIEYIFFRNNGASVPNPTPEDTSSDQYQEKGDYEDTEYVPAGWSDNPQGVNSDLKYEWVSQRKYRNNIWGNFSDPAVWAKYGDDGSDGVSGLSLRTMYAKYTIGSVPPLVATNVNPGSIWGTEFPTYNSETEVVWCTQAYFNYKNELATIEEDNVPVFGWQGPWVITGTPGKNGTSPNYKTYVYKQSSTKPAKPTGTDKIPSGWQDYPDDTGQWWQCIGTVNGVTELVTEWSEVLPVNGKDGTAQDGKFTEFRFAVNQSRTSAPSLTDNVRNPSGWNVNPPTVNDGYYLWMIIATINPDNTLNGTWSDPVCISGEQGPQGNTGPAGNRGPAGSDGVDGIHGVSIEVRYCLGTEDDYDGTMSPSGNSPVGWSTDIPTVTKLKPYIWCIQGRRVYANANDNTGTISWSTPFKLTGTNGLDGTSGGSQIIYPAGIYSNTESYTTDDKKAPYVLDTSDNNFYVLNAKMTWVGTQQNNRTPSQDYKLNDGEYWLLLEDFEAFYTKIGIIANGLIGSAVFNGDYVFSQQGINPSSSNAFTNTYENFDSSHIYDGTFTPNIMFNFKTGAGHLAAGKVKFNNDGSGSLGDGGFSWDSDGTIKYDGYEENMFITDGYSDNIVLPKIPIGYSKTIKISVTWISRVPLSIPLHTNNTDDIIYYGDDNSGTLEHKTDKSGKFSYTPLNNGISMITLTGFGKQEYDNKHVVYWFIEDVHIGNA